MPEVKTQQFKSASSVAMADPRLQAALRRVGGFDSARREAIDELTGPVWEELREKGRQIKRHTIENLDYYLEMLYDRVTDNGGQVHFAKDADEANAIVCGIALSRNVKLAIKSKSMVSEEMGLNHVLAENGVEALETDLGEYIIQLAEETPFHIIAPAIHKSKEEVSELFAKKIDVHNLVEIEEMARAARTKLRERFLEAEMGITGANFLVAETGTLAIVSNEGNGRMCTSVPRVHVALTGMEKVIPCLEDLAVFLRLLPRAATGQRITSYVSLVSGPKRAREEDGPEEFHLVIVDNGRSRLLRDPDLRDSLNCIRCGACLNVCPVYQKVGGHAYGWVYPGPIGAVISPVLLGPEKAKDLPYASTLCGACREVCPVKINLPHMLLKLRGRLMEGPKDSGRNITIQERLYAWGFQRLLGGPKVLALAHMLGKLVQKPIARRGVIRRLPLPPFSHWTKSRDLPALPKNTFHQLWNDKLHKGE
jgi:L-lactate dehydrogenase complex protein LldF